MRKIIGIAFGIVMLASAGCDDPELVSCIQRLTNGPMPTATVRTLRFQGKVDETTARCRGGDGAVRFLGFPWLDWTNYYATGGPATRSDPKRNFRGVGGALVDLEYERVELIRFNLFDNNGTFEAYVRGTPGRDGSTIDVWQQFRLPPDHPQYAAVGGANEQQRCTGALIRGRTLTGICNDTRNPLMGSTGALFANNAEFE